MRRRVLALVLGASMVMGLAACGSSSSTTQTGSTGTSTGTAASTEKTEEKTEEGGDTAEAAATVEGEGHLNIWLAGNGEAESSSAYKGILDAWVANNAPGYTYELTFIAWSDYFTKLSTALASGEGPDVFMTGYGQLGSMQAQGYTMNLSEKLGDDWSGYTDIPENILAAGMKDGNLYGILEPSTRLYYVNKSYAESLGLTEADLKIDSLEDLKKLADALVTEVAGTPIAGFHVYNMKEESIEQMAQSIALNYDGDFHMWDADGHATFNSEAGVKAIEFMNSILAEGYNQDYQAGFDQFSNGTCSMYLMSEASYRNYNNTLGEGNCYIVPCTLKTLLIGNFLTVNAGTKYEAAAVDCLKYLYSDDAQKAKASLGMFPTSSTLWDWYVEQYPEYAAVPTYYQNSYAYSDTLIPCFTQVITLYREAAANAMSGTPVQEALDAGAEAWNAIVDGN